MGFNELVSVIDKDKKLYIQMHRPPDPDCLACAAVLSDMLRSVDIASDIVYTGPISKPETVELIGNLGLKLYRLDSEKYKELVTEDDQIIVVDCQKDNGNVAPLTGNYIACIDHHPDTNRTYAYVDIRDDYGACSSIIYEYAKEAGYDISPAQAALLIYGIRIDTDELTRKKYLKDIDVFVELYKIADLGILSSIGRNRIRPEDISTTIVAYENLTIKNGIAYSFAGDDKAKESLAELADKLISLADISFVVVYSKCFNGYTFSIRSQTYKMNAEKITKTAFSKVNGDGGGHKYMAGGVIPKVAFMDLSGAKAVMERIIDLIEEAIDTVRNEAEDE